MAVDDPIAPLRRDVFDEGEALAVVATGVDERELLVMGWFASEADSGARGAHLALRQARQDGAETLAVHVSRVPAVVAALTEVSLRLTQLWERDGEAYWAGQASAGGSEPQGALRHPARPPARSGGERAARRRGKAALLERVRERAPEVLAAFLGADDDDQAAARLAEVLGTSPEESLELVDHLQFKELTRAARRRAQAAPPV